MDSKRCPEILRGTAIFLRINSCPLIRAKYSGYAVCTLESAKCILITEWFGGVRAQCEQIPRFWRHRCTPPPPSPANIDYSIHLRKKILASSLVPENWRKISKGIGYIPYRDIVRTIRILQRDNLTGLIRLAIWQVVTIFFHGLIIPLLLLVGWSCVFWTQNWFLILNWL